MSWGNICEGGRILAVFEGGKDVQSSGKRFKVQPSIWARVQTKWSMSYGKEMTVELHDENGRGTRRRQALLTNICVWGCVLIFCTHMCVCVSCRPVINVRYLS